MDKNGHIVGIFGRKSNKNPIYILCDRIFVYMPDIQTKKMIRRFLPKYPFYFGIPLFSTEAR